MAKDHAIVCLDGPGLGSTNSIQFIQRKPIFNISDLEECYRQGAGKMQEEDPQGPRILILNFDPGTNRAFPRKTLRCPDLKISRTYSLSGEPNRYAATGVSIFNHVFTDTPSRTPLSNWQIEEITSEELVPWRKGYYEKPRSWEKSGPSPGDTNEVTRRFGSQKQFQSQHMPAPKRSVEERLSAKAKQLSKAAAKWRRKRNKHTNDSGSESDSSSTSSTSSDSSSTSVAPTR